MQTSSTTPCAPRGNYNVTPDLLGFVAGMAAELKAGGKPHRVRALERFRRNLTKMAGDERLPFGDVGGDFARRYLEWLQQKGMAQSTCAAELGVLRSVMTRAVEAGLLESVPDIPKGVHYVRRPKPEGEFPGREVFERLGDLDLDDPKLSLARDMFLFAYYCGGMELVDVAALTPANVIGNLLRYTRRTKGRECNVRFDGKAAAIVSRYLFLGNAYLFPVHGGKRETTFENTRRLIDKRLKALGDMAGCPGLNFSMNIAAGLAQIPRTECGGVTSVWDRFRP